MPNTDVTLNPVSSPLTLEEGKGPAEGAALCLSGGGYRAMLFHVGVLWRLNEAGVLVRLERISSVSGGSITAAELGLNLWKLAVQDGEPPLYSFIDHVVRPICRLALKTIDVKSIVSGVFLPGSISSKVAN